MQAIEWQKIYVTHFVLQKNFFRLNIFIDRIIYVGGGDKIQETSAKIYITSILNVDIEYVKTLDSFQCSLFLEKKISNLI